MIYIHIAVVIGIIYLIHQIKEISDYIRTKEQFYLDLFAENLELYKENKELRKEKG
jgi:hypothetical protein